LLLTGPADVTGYDGLVTERAGDGIVPEPSDWLADMPSADPPHLAGTDSPRQAGADSPRPPESDPAAAELRDRMERLPPGHPSSPYRGDGSPKPPEPDQSDREYPIPGDPDYRLNTPDTPDAAQLSETVAMASGASTDRTSEAAAETSPDRHLETPTDASADRDPHAAEDPAQLGDVQPDVEPLTDAEYAEHVQDVRERLDQAREQGRATNEEYTIDTRGEVWLEQREAFHDALIDEFYARAANVPAEHRAIIVGGLPGAGKSTVLERYAGIDRSRFLTIDPDKVKEELARHDLVPVVEGLSPMEASDLVHEESSYIAKRLARRAQADGKNVIWDITMSTRVSTEQRIEALRALGYTHIEGIFVDIPLTTSEERTTARHRMDQEEYRAGKGQGGRLIPTDLTSGSGDPVWGA
jgi:predicted kinase